MDRILKIRSASSVRALWFAVAVFAASPSSGIAGDTWDGGSGTSSDWNDRFNWNDDQLPGYGSLFFSGTARTSNTNNLLGSMNYVAWYGTGPWTLGALGGNVLALYDNGGSQAKLENRSSGLVTINAPITFAATSGTRRGEINTISGDMLFGSAATLNVNGSAVDGIRLYGTGQTTTFNNTVNASGKYFSTSGTGKTVVVGGAFTAANFYVMNNGTLSLTTSNSGIEAVYLGGDYGATGDQVLSQSGTLKLSNAAGGLTFAGSIYPVASNTSGALTVESNNSSGTNTLTGSVSLESPLVIHQSGTGRLVVGGSNPGVGFNSKQLTFRSAGRIDVTRAMGNGTNTGSVVIDGPGVVAFGGQAQYGGGTTINSGSTLLANFVNASVATESATGSGSVTVNGTLAGNGRVGGAVTVNGTISAGDGVGIGDAVGTLRTAGQTWPAGGTYAFNVASTSGAETSAGSTAGAGSSWDKLNMTTLSITSSGSSSAQATRFTIKVVGGAGLQFVNGAMFELANISSGTVSYAASTLADSFYLDTSALGIPSSNFTIQQGTPGAGEGGADLFLAYTGATMTSTPEPTSAALGGLAMTTVLGLRRGRRPASVVVI